MGIFNISSNNNLFSFLKLNGLGSNILSPLLLVYLNPKVQNEFFIFIKLIFFSVIITESAKLELIEKLGYSFLISSKVKSLCS